MKENKLTDITLAGKQAFAVWQGQVHSVFANAVNIVTATHRFTLLTNPLWISEHNLILANSDLFPLFKPGDQVRSDQHFLYLAGQPVAQFQPAAIWQMPAVKQHPLSSAHKTTLAAYLSAISSYAETATTVWHQQIEQRFITVSQQFCHHQPADFSTIIGAGPGLTPSGDDMLVGFACALWYCSPAKLPMLASSCQHYLKQTTDISRFLLQDALTGYFTAPLVNLVLGLQQNADISEAITVASQIGSSSGRDGLWGFYYGLLAIEDRLAD